MLRLHPELEIEHVGRADGERVDDQEGSQKYRCHADRFHRRAVWHGAAGMPSWQTWENAGSKRGIGIELCRGTR